MVVGKPAATSLANDGPAKKVTVQKQAKQIEKPITDVNKRDTSKK